MPSVSSTAIEDKSSNGKFEVSVNFPKGCEIWSSYRLTAFIENLLVYFSQIFDLIFFWRHELNIIILSSAIQKSTVWKMSWNVVNKKRKSKHTSSNINHILSYWKKITFTFTQLCCLSKEFFNFLTFSRRLKISFHPHTSSKVMDVSHPLLHPFFLFLGSSFVVIAHIYLFQSEEFPTRNELQNSTMSTLRTLFVPKTWKLNFSLLIHSIPPFFLPFLIPATITPPVEIGDRSERYSA